MESPELKPGSKLGEIKQEFLQAEDFVENSLGDLDEIIKKYEFLNEFHEKTNEYWYQDKIQELYDHLKTFYKSVDYDKIEESDKSGISEILANIIRQIEVNSINTQLEKKYGEYSRERKPELKEKIKDQIDELSKKKDSLNEPKRIEEIISNIEEPMSTQKGPGGGPKNPPAPRRSAEDEIKIIEAKNKADIEKAKELSKINLKEKKKEAKIERKNKEKVDEKSMISEIAEKEANGITLTTDEENLKTKHPILFKRELKKHLDNLEHPDEIVEKIAILELEGGKLSGSDLKFASDPDNRSNIDDFRNKIEVLAEKLAKGEKYTKWNKTNKDFYKKHKDIIDEQSNILKEDIIESSESRLEELAEMIFNGTTLTTDQEDEVKKNEEKILSIAAKKFELDEKSKIVRREIAILELDNEPNPAPLTPGQEMRTRIPSERIEIDREKDKIRAERAEMDRIAALLLANPNLVLSPGEKKFYDTNKEVIDDKIVKLKEKAIEDQKTEIIRKKVEGIALNDEEETFFASNSAELRPKITDKLKEELEKSRAGTGAHTESDIKDRINENIRLSEKSRGAYKPLADRLANTLNNETYKNLLAKPAGSLSDAEKTLLDEYNKEVNTIKSSLDAMGPSGQMFAELEVNRANLAKASKEFEASFVRKFPGAKIVGVIGGMFGAKWSAVKEGAKTKDAKSAMDNNQIKYDEVRRKLMNTLVDEEHSVRKAYGEKGVDMARDWKIQEFLRSVNKEFVEDEHKKLDDMKHVLEDTVRGSAMRKFGEFYSKKFMNFGPFKDNVIARNTAKRVVSAAVLGSILIPFTSAGAAGYLGYRVTRAAISGMAGESAAAAVARVFGGAMNEKGEFEKFAKKRDTETADARNEFIKEMTKKFETDVKPEVTPTMMDKIRKDHTKTVNNYMNRQGNLRRAELWARLIAGGATAYGLSQVLPSPEAITDTGPVSGPSPEVPPVVEPNPDLTLEGISVDASAKGSIQTFMNLKKEMLDHYANDPRFAGLSRDQMAEKMIQEGNMDPFVEQIMGSKSYADFAEVAKDHGFWKLSGVGNPNVDSASVPAGSTIGFETGSDGDLHYFIKTPSGDRLDITNFTDEASGKFKGVKLIDTTVPHPAPSASGIETSSAGGEVPPPPDSLLDESEFGQSGVGGNVIKIENANLEGATVIGGKGIIDVPPATGGIDDKLKFYKSISNPGNEHEYYTNKYGFESKGKMTYMPGTAEDPTTEYYDKAGNYYYTEQYSGYYKEVGGPHDIKNSPMYREYHAMQDNYNTAQQEIIKLEKAKLDAVRADVDNAYQPGASVNTPAVDPEVAQAREIAIRESTNEINNDWVDDTFGKTNIWGVHKPGIDSNAWNDIKGDKVEDLVRSGKTPNGDDVYGGSSLSKKESNFLDLLINKSQTYGINPNKGETVESFTRRLAEAEARSKMVATR